MVKSKLLLGVASRETITHNSFALLLCHLRELQLKVLIVLSLTSE